MNHMKQLTITSDAPGAPLLLLGNEAIARGAIEAGVTVLSSYPGTPSSEIGQAVIDAAKDLPHMYVEWSANEKLGFEVAFSASMTGVRTMTTMKHVGLNVAHDPVMTACNMGVKGGLVVVVADDPHMHSSQNEQDSRYVALQGYLPVFEPATGQEAKDMMADAFMFSEEWGQMVMFRPVTRLSHARSRVILGPIERPEREAVFDKDSTRWVCQPSNSRRHRVEMLTRHARIKEAADSFKYNRLDLRPGAKLGIIASGLGWAYLEDAVRWLGIADQVSILKLGMTVPIPDKLVLELLEATPEVLVVEDLEPIIENQVKVVAQNHKIAKTIHGKNVVPVNGELSTRRVMEALAQVLSVEMPVDFRSLDAVGDEAAPLLPLRPPALCSGCPHRASLYAEGQAARKYKREFKKEVAARCGDIGCYGLGFFAPLSSDDTQICMSASLGAAQGIAQATGGPTIAHIGDSTFFHSGLSSLANAVFNNANVTLLILDNAITAQTGFQEDPATGRTASGSPSPVIKPEDVARAMQVKFVEVVDPFEVDTTIDTIGRALRSEGPAVVVCRQACQVLKQRELKEEGKRFVPCEIDREACNDCRVCIKRLGCPAILIEAEGVVIDSGQCTGCMVCAAVCPKDAIKSVGSR
ncbi:MAG: indolepyruvate ferredoxin oxidoreductase subunit alpha [Actinomycetia bacterium]|nr:indolepyruvate ferredoxin oxidoreductase subunit alpha [Actinomycetes bacterium]